MIYSAFSESSEAKISGRYTRHRRRAPPISRHNFIRENKRFTRVSFSGTFGGYRRFVGL
jgi:hypothetical protein